LALCSLGFLKVLQEAGGFVGGLLVTNPWGRPLEFRLTSAVQPNRVQQILYGGSLSSYVCADLIGKALLDKAGVAVQLVITDREAVLDLRLKVEVPVLWLAGAEDARGAALATIGAVLPATAAKGPLVCHPRFLADVAVARELLAKAEGLDLAEPFVRIREAIAEARKMGATSR
jgi:hypothetical protein